MHEDRVARFTAFAHARMPAMLRLAYLLTGERQSAEDVVQIALAKIYTHWGAVERATSPEAYAHRIVANAAVDHARKRKDIPSDLRPEARVTMGGLPGIEAGLDLRRGLTALPPRQRAVVVLRFYLDLSEREIAHALGIGVGTVKSHASRGLASLRRTLSDDAAEDDHALKH